MGKILANFRTTVIISVLIALLIVISYGTHPGTAHERYWEAVFRWLHVFFGILWIGLLYYFNFVQIRKMPDIPAELRPAVSKFIAPEALFWFRWAALITVIMGLILAYTRNYLVQALSLGGTEGFQVASHTFIGVGMWVGIIMMLNVWGIIWPNQKIALGIVDGDADAKAKAARVAMLASRTNMLLSIPMLVFMTMNQTMFG